MVGKHMWELSDFGRRFAGVVGINALMEDLGDALSSNRDMLMLGGGNPSHIPAVQARIRERAGKLLAMPGQFEHVVGDYDAPQGATAFREVLADLLQRSYGWQISTRNIALTNGSQNSFFFLFNLFAGKTNAGGKRKRILLPLTPEYIGYTDVGVEPDLFLARRPEITRLGADMFKYHIDFENLSVGDDVGAICVSRPTNPTGNVLTDAEVLRLSGLAQEAGVPLILDNAYGTPFPNIIYQDVQPIWNENTIICMSLSKLGLPGVRTGIVVAPEHIIRIVACMSAVFCLAPNSMGAALAMDLVQSGEITRMSRDLIRPYYERKVQRAVEELRAYMHGIPFAMHKPEGALFLWLWFEGLPISSRALYERLKARGVLVVPGSYFFPGLEEDWRHREECIRITYAQDEDVVSRGLRILADEVRAIYAGKRA